MSDSDYTKVSNNMVAKYGIKVAYIYAKLHYRMNLSNKNHHFKDNNGHFIIYKVNDLAHDCHLGRSSVINALKKLEHAGLISKIRTMFANRIYLPKFDNDVSTSDKQTSVSTKSKLSKKQRYNNQNNNNKYVYCSSCSTVKKANRKYPDIQKMIKRFGKALFNYAINKYHDEKMFEKVNNPKHFIYGILRRWQRKGINTVNRAMLSEHDSRAKLPDNGPKIPIFKI